MPNEGHGHHALHKRTLDEKPRSRTHWKLANTKTGPSQSHSAAAGNGICTLNFGIQVHALHLGGNVIECIDEQRLTVVAPACDPLPIADCREGAPPSTGYRTVRPFRARYLPLTTRPGAENRTPSGVIRRPVRETDVVFHWTPSAPRKTHPGNTSDSAWIVMTSAAVRLISPS
jgi:hypothetical protein